jgi:hypothetical protein
MVKRYFVQNDDLNTKLPATDWAESSYHEVVLATDYDALEAENAKMRAGYPYLNECLQLQARVKALEILLPPSPR